MSKITFLELTWRDWVVSNVQRECSRESMVEKNFEAEFAKRIEEIGRVVELRGGSVGRPATTDLATAGFLGERGVVSPLVVRMAGENQGADAAPFANLRDGYVGDASRLSAGNVIHVGDRAVRVLARLKRPEVLVLGNVLSDDECLELMQQSEEKLARSTTIDPKTGQEIVIANRSSSGTFFYLHEDDFIARIDQRLSELLRWPVDHGEGLQILRYEVGGEYWPHFDYFPPGDSGSGPHVAQGGQRIGTLVMYLNDVEDGGETIFPEIGLSVVPRRGHAVYFGYCNSRGDIDPLTLHGGAPVRAGVKWIATKWLRQHRRG